VHGVNDVSHTELQTAEPIVPEQSTFDVEMATEKLKRHESPSNDQIPAELVEVGDRTIHSEIHKLVSSFWSKEELLESGKSQLVYL
jgi:regulator of sirC expression with transglutaminase-like and TPR domain